MKHSKFSASAAHRWLSCPASLGMAAAAPEQSRTSDAAREGTGLHAALDECLTRGINAPELETVLFNDHGEACQITLNDEQIDAVQFCIDKVNALPGELFSDQRVDYSSTLRQMPGTAFGTLDVAKLDGTHLHIADAKFGRHYVDEVENKQMLLYAVGMVESIEVLGDEVRQITMHILQPRCNAERGEGWTISRDELHRRSQDMAIACDIANEAEREILKHLPNPLPQGVVDKFFAPDTETCRWCPAAAFCPALKQRQESLEALRTYETAALTDEAIVDAMQLADLADVFIKAVREEAVRRVTSGQKVSGYKMVLGRAGNRRWEDEDNTVRTLALAGIAPEDMKEPGKLLSPAKMDKVAKAAGLDKATVEALTVRNPPKPTLVLESAPGEPWQPEGADLSEFGLVP